MPGIRTGMTLVFTIIAFIVALGVLILFHEFGHYLVARWSGVKVLRFSVGFGQPLLTRRLGKDQTEWVVAAFPLGGYVKMLDEQEGQVEPQDRARAFNRKPVGYRFAIVAAGPIANFLLAILLYWFLFMLGVSGMKPVLGPVKSATPAAFAGFEAGETILKIGTEPVIDLAGCPLAATVQSGGQVTIGRCGKPGRERRNHHAADRLEPSQRR